METTGRPDNEQPPASSESPPPESVEGETVRPEPVEGPPAEPTPAEQHAARVLDALRSISAEATAQAHHKYVEVFVPREHLETAARALKERLGYDYLSMVTAVDWPDRIEVIYLIYSLDHSHGVYLKANLPREDLPESPTLTTVWPGAEFQERETYDLMGINFVGHPDLTRILTEDSFPGHPLRKDYRQSPDYVLMRHLRHGAEGQLAPSEPETPTSAPIGPEGP